MTLAELETWKNELKDLSAEELKVFARIAKMLQTDRERALSIIGNVQEQFATKK